MVQTIKAGSIYWVTIGGHRIRIQALEPYAGRAGWWHVEVVSGGLLMIMPVNDGWQLDGQEPETSPPANLGRSKVSEQPDVDACGAGPQ